MSFSNQDENREDLRKTKITKELSRTLKALQAQQLLDEPVYSNELSNKLCDILEAIFLHGLKEPVAHKLRMFMQQNTGQVSTLNFWKFVCKFTHKNVISQIQELKQIKTDVGYCRVWVRMALNDGLLCSYIDAMTADHSTLESFYYQLAYLRDLEQPGIFKSYVQGLMAFQFELPYNSSVLNSWMNTPLLLAGIEGALMPEEEQPKNESVGTNTDTTDDTNTDTADLTSSTLTPGADSSISTNPFTASTISTAESDSNTLTFDDADATHSDNSTALAKGPKVSENSQQNHETPSEPIINNSVKPNPESSCTIIEDNRADNNTTKKETNSVLTNSKKTHHPTGVGKAPNINNNNNKTSKESKGKSGNIQCQQSRQRPNTLNIGNSPGGNSLNLGNSLEIASGWSSVFLEDPVPVPALASAPEPFTEPAEIVVVQDAENFESLVENYTREHRLSPIPFGEIAESSPENKNGHTKDRSEKDHQTRIGNLMRICNEKGIASQDYQCNSCPSPLGLLYGKPLVCTYDGCYYCTDCHHNDEFYIPSRIIFNWDFSKYKVCVRNLEFLKEIQEYPLIDIDKINPELYDYISDMRDTKYLRIRLAHLSSYLFTCKKSVAEKFRQSLWPKEYLYEDIHIYSIIDFLQIQSGQLQAMLKKSLKTASKHVYECGLCSQKGFICEICKNPQVIYPFEMDTTHRCEQCKAVYHKTCMNLKGQCPKCERRRQRFMKIGPVSTSPEPEYDVIPWDTT